MLVGARLFLFLDRSRAAVAIDLRLGPGLVELGPGFLQGSPRAGAIDRLAVKARHVHLDVSGEEHQIGGGNLVRRQGILGTDRSLGLDADLVTQLLGHGLQGLGRHEGVGHPGRAGRHRHDALGTAGRFGNHRRRLMAIDAGTASRGVQQGSGILERQIHVAPIERLAIIGGQIHRCAGNDQHQVGGGNQLFRGNLTGLHAGVDVEGELPASQFGLLFYPFCSEKAGGNARRASRNQNCFHWASPELAIKWGWG